MANCELFLTMFDLALIIALKGGEIDIIEGVHDNEHNQVTWHTSAGHSYGVVCSHEDANAILGCNLTQSSDFTGTIVVRDKLRL